jgi:c-di-GMP-binding flagellar brake protein YcgR
MPDMSEYRNPERSIQFTSELMEQRRQKMRRAPRVDIASWAEIQETGKETPPLSATVRDISRGGLGAYMTTFIPKDTRVEILLKFVSSDQRFVTEKLQGRVVNSKKIGSLYNIGIEFTERIADEKNPKLSEFLRSTEGV